MAWVIIGIFWFAVLGLGGGKTFGVALTNSVLIWIAGYMIISYMGKVGWL
jgi:hypothetical protein